jgi:hypothetical protein
MIECIDLILIMKKYITFVLAIAGVALLNTGCTKNVLTVNGSEMSMTGTIVEIDASQKTKQELLNYEVLFMLSVNVTRPRLKTYSTASFK